MRRKNIIILAVLSVMIFLLPFYLNHSYEQKKEDAMSGFQEGLDLYTRALDKYQENEPEEVIKLTNKAIEKLPRNLSITPYAYALSDTCSLRARANEQLGFSSLAFRDYTKVIQVGANDPRTISAYNNRAAVRIKLNDPEGAVRDLNNSLSIDPAYGSTYHRRGLVKISMGDRETGCMDLERAEFEGDQSVNQSIRKYCDK